MRLRALTANPETSPPVPPRADAAAAQCFDEEFGQEQQKAAFRVGSLPPRRPAGKRSARPAAVCPRRRWT